MKTYVEIDGIRYIATIGGKMNDGEWDGRESKSIRAEMTYNDAIAHFVDGATWNIIQEVEEAQIEYIDEDEKEVVKNVIREEVYDNSEFNMAGEIIDHRDGTVTVKMGKPSDLEVAMATIDEILIAMEV